MNKLLYLLTFCVISTVSKAQNTVDEKSTIENNTAYFNLERENIHTQFNKTVYTTGETIWLKGYVIDKITGLPNIKSSNIIMELLNSNGEKIDSKLLYSENSTFHGFYNTDKITESGNYSFRFFTNYMNNFSEDESSSYEITIVNPTNYKMDLTSKFNPNKININYYPESGVLLENTDNDIVAEIKDCNGIGSTIKDIEVLNDKNEVVTTFSTNEQGYGKFKLLESKNLEYKIKIKNEQNILQEKVIEKPKKIGYLISINDNFNSETLYVDIKTNKATIATNKTVWLGIQHLDNLNLVKVDFDANTQLKKLAFSKKELNNGITNFILFDEKKDIISERLYYNSKVNSAIEMTNKIVTNDSIKYKFKSNFNLGELSYSIMPSKTLTRPNKYSIHSSLLLNNHLTTEITNSSYYFNNYNRLKHFELDLALFGNKYKYNFLQNINIPTENFKSENGLSLIGKINSETSNKDNKINLLCISTGVSLNTDINEKNEFQFENLVVSDSTSIFLSMVNKKNEVKNFASAFNLVKAKNQFYKPFKAKQTCFDESANKVSFKFPKTDKNTHLLDSIQINKTLVKPKLVNRKNAAYGSSFIDGYKIDDEQVRRYSDVISFIRAKGYNIETSGGNVTITTRTSRSFNQDSTPTILIDNSPLDDFTFLYGMRMDQIDEIYINKRGFGAGSAGRNGVISIFTKRTMGAGKTAFKSSAKNYVCKDGFTPFLPFKNNLSINFNDESFLNFGNVFWNPRTVTNQNGEFEISLPKVNDGALILVLDGINSTGQIISKTIEIQP
ncbi:hypothetical protein EQG63_00935 [Flavobacterium amnicola]|uniref:TonB-dependent receptor plug domain-containing protein n=1 Tax=Flavobacterium amnicola TaxID=2506422 RepID=A0A4Q1K495_9FLAO|nr:hypothetical protein [Flavobacterium amnicola]RXR20528.1 hypothetical protein EQG63_00935 [Flavobacterium amnicola]